MSIHTLNSIVKRNASLNNKYGVTESKKAEIDALTMQVLNAQQNVALFQTIVESLTDKYNNFQTLLNTANTTRTQAFNNKNLGTQLVQSANNLMNNSSVAFNEVVDAKSKLNEVAVNVKNLMDKLIYSVEVINKLATTVIRKKALNPLISDELVSMLSTAGSDANNVIALTLVALKSTFASQGSVMESESAIELSYAQAKELYNTLTVVPDASGNEKTYSLASILDVAYADAQKNYAYMENAVAITEKQLSDAKADLSKAQIKLKSLQSGLAAANAAALAS